MPGISFTDTHRIKGRAEGIRICDITTLGANLLEKRKMLVECIGMGPECLVQLLILLFVNCEMLNSFKPFCVSVSSSLR